MVSWLEKGGHDFGDFDDAGLDFGGDFNDFDDFVLILPAEPTDATAARSSSRVFDPWSNYRILRNMLKIEKIEKLQILRIL